MGASCNCLHIRWSADIVSLQATARTFGKTCSPFRIMLCCARLCARRDLYGQACDHESTAASCR